MKANEMRVGNYYQNESGDIFKVTPSIIEEVWSAERSWVKSIELNEEWLKRMGFEKCQTDEAYGLEYFHRGISIYFKDNTFRFYVGKTNRSWTEYEYVHEVMNLFHSLTGHELEIK